MSVNRSVLLGAVLLASATITSCTASSSPSAHASATVAAGGQSYHAGDVCSLLTPADAAAFMKSFDVTETLHQERLGAGSYGGGSLGRCTYDISQSQNSLDATLFVTVPLDAFIADQSRTDKNNGTSERVRGVGKAAFFNLESLNTTTGYTTAGLYVFTDRGIVWLAVTVPGLDVAALRSAVIRLGTMTAGRLQ